jgi:hypothetical protein
MDFSHHNTSTVSEALSDGLSDEIFDGHCDEHNGRPNDGQSAHVNATLGCNGWPAESLSTHHDSDQSMTAVNAVAAHVQKKARIVHLICRHAAFQLLGARFIHSPSCVSFCI